MFESEYFNYGVVVADYSHIKVYRSYYDYRCIPVAQPLENAWWSGRSLFCSFKNENAVYRILNWNGSMIRVA